MIKYLDNVKKGDLIYTEIGHGILLRQTRAKWFYLFNSRHIGIRKSDFWELVDIGKIQITYIENAKYRTKQRKMRTLDLRGVYSYSEQIEKYEEFESFVKPPFNIAFDSNIGLNANYFINETERLNCDYEIERSPTGVTMFRVYEYD
jgi:hypothetical protein